MSRGVLWFALLLLSALCVGCVFGCGQPLYPKVAIQVDPATGRVGYASEMETDLVIGPVVALESPDGTKMLRVGTATQPAMAYGSKAVGVMQEYANQQTRYKEILEVVGDDVTNDLNAIGNWIPGITSLMQGAGIPQAKVDQSLAPILSLIANMRSQQMLINSAKAPE